MDYLEQRRADIARHRENRARPAQAFARFETTGSGSLEFEERIDFGLTFIERPFVAYGSQLDLDELANALDLDPEGTPPLPLATGVVAAWDRDDRDFYIGAWVAVRIWFPGDDPATSALGFTMSHHFTFTAVAMKDVPVDVRT